MKSRVKDQNMVLYFLLDQSMLFANDDEREVSVVCTCMLVGRIRIYDHLIRSYSHEYTDSFQRALDRFEFLLIDQRGLVC